MYKGLPILYRSPIEIRELIINYVSEHGTIPTAANRTWQVIPPEAVAAMRALAARGSSDSTKGPPRNPVALPSDSSAQIPAAAR